MTENGIAMFLDRRLMTYKRKHWMPTIRGGALLKPTSLIGAENKRAGNGPDRMRGSSGRESHSGGMLKVPFSARLIADSTANFDPKYSDKEHAKKKKPILKLLL